MQDAPAPGPAESIGIPPLNLTGGHAQSEAASTSGGTASGVTGTFQFKGTHTGGWTSVLSSLAPALIIGGVLLWAMRRK